MTLKLFSIAFFKENKIKYFNNNDSIIFQCCSCGSEAIMESNTNWKCPNCLQSGNFKTLMDLVNEELVQDLNKKTFYNPKQERYDINKIMNKLIKENKGTELEKELSKVSLKLKRLTEYMIEKELSNYRIDDNEKERLV